MAQQHEEFVAHDERERRRLLRIEERQRLDEWVRPLIEKFGALTHPTMFVQVFDEAWSLGHWQKKMDGSNHWFQAVDVILHYDKFDRAQNLECRRQSRSLRVALDPTALSKALMQLHAQPKRREG